MEDTADARLLTWASQSQNAGEDPSAGLQFMQDLRNYRPTYDDYAETKGTSHLLRTLQMPPSGDLQAVAMAKSKIEKEPGTLKAVMDVLNIKDDPKPKQYVLAALYEMIRHDSSCFNLFEDCMKSGFSFTKGLMVPLAKGASGVDVYVVDMSAYLLSALMGHCPRYFSEGDVTNFLKVLLDCQKSSDLGTLEAITNVTKADVFRGKVLGVPGVADAIFKVTPDSPAPVLYRFAFAIWMLSSDKQVVPKLRDNQVVKKIKQIMTGCRSEKVVRLSLTVLQQLLNNKATSEDIVDEDLLETVHQLEYEKWRDADLYDDIHEVSDKIQAQVKDLSGFDKYERELNTGVLKWGYIHSGKFWQENVMKFEEGNFRALNTLTELLNRTTSDNTTLAICCNDLGQFVALHPLGKKKANQLGIKQRVMELMSTSDPSMRDVRREALLCCQKIMLNNWADAQAK